MKRNGTHTHTHTCCNSFWKRGKGFPVVSVIGAGWESCVLPPSDKRQCSHLCFSSKGRCLTWPCSCQLVCSVSLAGVSSLQNVASSCFDREDLIAVEQRLRVYLLGPPARCPSLPISGKGSPTKIETTEKDKKTSGTPVLTSQIWRT